MKLQIALDEFDVISGTALIQKLRNSVDIIEIGTPFLLKYGMDAVRSFRSSFPEKQILADTKIMDAGRLEAEIAFEAGADFVTVLGVTDLRTIQECTGIAKVYGKRIVVDMICVENLEERVSQLEEYGIHAIAVHTGVDQQTAGRNPLDDLKRIRASSRQSEIFVAGGIDESSLPNYIEAGADVIIVGSAIVHACDPVIHAKKLYQMVKGLV